MGKEQAALNMVKVNLSKQHCSAIHMQAQIRSSCPTLQTEEKTTTKQHRNWERKTMFEIVIR